MVVTTVVVPADVGLVEGTPLTAKLPIPVKLDVPWAVAEEAALQGGSGGCGAELLGVLW